MNAVTDIFTANEEFFAPAATDLIDSLVGQYRTMRSHIEQLSGIVAGDIGNAVHYFLEGNAGDEKVHLSLYVNKLFNPAGAIKALNAAYWSKSLALTDVLELMPHARRQEWFEQIRKMETPEFEESTVRSTLADLLASRQRFFSEKVDGIFRSLSHEHVTNCPQGFSKRMILAYVVDQKWESVNYKQSGHIADLRKVIAKFMGREEPKWNATDHLIRTARARSGEWINVDGGAMRIRVYKVGTAHLEIHPDIAWRLNQTLAFLYPMAIPSEFRTKPAKKNKEFTMMDRPLPFSVLELLGGMRQARERIKPDWPEKHVNVQNALMFNYGSHNANTVAEAEKVIASIGGVKTNMYYQFDYDAFDVVKEIACSGCVPDQKSHQYYPTPSSVAEEVIITADIQIGDICLEPSAGQGGLADLMPIAQTTCIEISELHCKILEAKSHNVIKADFLSWTGGAFDKIVMNPPYSEGRWQAHIEHAASLLNPNGSLIAVLPSSAKNKDVLPGLNCSWSRVFTNEFEGTSISVVILKATA